MRCGQPSSPPAVGGPVGLVPGGRGGHTRRARCGSERCARVSCRSRRSERWRCLLLWLVWMRLRARWCSRHWLLHCMYSRRPQVCVRGACCVRHCNPAGVCVLLLCPPATAAGAVPGRCGVSCVQQQGDRIISQGEPAAAKACTLDSCCSGAQGVGLVLLECGMCDGIVCMAAASA